MKRGEFTFTGGKRNTIINYTIGDKEAKEETDRMRVGNKVDSNHQPVEVWIKGEEEKEVGGRKRRRWRGTWNEKGSDRFIKKLENIKLGDGKIGEEWDKVERKIKEAMKKTESEMGKKKRGWWDKECERRRN